MLLAVKPLLLPEQAATPAAAAEQGADEAFGFAVGLGAVGARAEVADAQRAAGDRVDASDSRDPLSVISCWTWMPWRA